MELYLLQLVLLCYLVVWRYHHENLYQPTRHSGGVLAVISFFSTQPYPDGGFETHDDEDPQTATGHDPDCRVVSD